MAMNKPQFCRFLRLPKMPATMTNAPPGQLLSPYRLTRSPENLP